MVTEQEAREAAARLTTNGGERWARIAETDYRESVEYEQDVQATAEWTLQELSRRDAERAERALPITAEWCLANGATTKGNGLYQWTIVDVEVEWDSTSGVTVRDDSVWTFLDTITTRGQLLDLLAALKGGAT